MKNNQGFTLVELLVTIALIGIISGIAFPAITKLKTQNKNKEYETYEEVILNGAKIFMDDNVDIWKNNTTKCRKISFSKLLPYIKEYKQNGVTCNESYAIVERDNEYNITYTPVVICKKNSKEIYKTSSSKTCSVLA